MNVGIYIMTNASHSTLYVGMSTDLPERIASHKEGLVDGFAKKYRCTILVYYEGCDSIDHAYIREKQIKGWTRNKKVALIQMRNPTWNDVYKELIAESV